MLEYRSNGIDSSVSYDLLTFRGRRVQIEWVMGGLTLWPFFIYCFAWSLSRRFLGLPRYSWSLLLLGYGKEESFDYFCQVFAVNTFPFCYKGSSEPLIIVQNGQTLGNVHITIQKTSTPNTKESHRETNHEICLWKKGIQGLIQHYGKRMVAGFSLLCQLYFFFNDPYSLSNLPL